MCFTYKPTLICIYSLAYNHRLIRLEHEGNCCKYLDGEKKVYCLEEDQLDQVTLSVIIEDVCLHTSTAGIIRNLNSEPTRFLTNRNKFDL